jgi:hypothetical protein
VSAISIPAVNFKNFDPLVYNDTAALKREYNELAMMAVKETDGYDHPADLLSHEIRMYLE